MSRRISFFLAVLCLFFAAVPAAAHAQAPGIDCLFATKGKTVEWDKDWQMDAQDHNVRYKITNIREIVKPAAPRTIELKLEAEGPASKPSRTASIVKLIAARMFCERIVGGLGDRSKGVQFALGGRDAARAAQTEIDEFLPSLELDPAKLSFRRWLHGKWVPARAAPDEILAVCQTQLLAFACNQQDHEWLQTQKLQVTKPWVELETEEAFLRHTNVGWVRDDAIGALAESPLSRCSILGKKFLCLSSEREKYGAELKGLEEEVALQRKLHPPPVEEVPAKKAK